MEVEVCALYFRTAERILGNTSDSLLGGTRSCSLHASKDHSRNSPGKKPGVQDRTSPNLTQSHIHTLASPTPNSAQSKPCIARRVVQHYCLLHHCGPWGACST